MKAPFPSSLSGKGTTWGAEAPPPTILSQPLLKDTLHQLADSEVFLLDGGTGEELFRRGVPDDRTIWSATAVVHAKHHETLQGVHASFLQAGSQAVTTNSYGIVPGVGFDDDAKRCQFLSSSGELARRAVSEAAATANRPLFVLGSLGPLVESYRSDLIMEHAEGVKNYCLACRALQPHVDGFLAETMSCVEESLQALEAVASLESTVDNSPTRPLPLLIAFTLDSKGHTRDGQVVTEALQQLLDGAQEKKIDLLAILFNCSEPEAITLALARIAVDSKLVHQLRTSKIKLGAYANRLTPVDPDWTLADSAAAQPFRKDLDPTKYWNQFVQLWTEQLGVQIVGGCCGMTPEHISYIHTQLLQQQQRIDDDK